MRGQLRLARPRPPISENLLVNKPPLHALLVLPRAAVQESVRHFRERDIRKAIGTHGWATKPRSAKISTSSLSWAWSPSSWWQGLPEAPRPFALLSRAYFKSIFQPLVTAAGDLGDFSFISQGFQQVSSLPDPTAGHTHTHTTHTGLESRWG